jgi:hypothetical protein
MTKVMSCGTVVPGEQGREDWELVGNHAKEALNNASARQNKTKINSVAGHESGYALLSVHAVGRVGEIEEIRKLP